MTLFSQKSKSTPTPQKSSEDFFGVQAKLSIGKSNDKYEVEADKMADTVVTNKQTKNTDSFFNPSPVVQRKLANEVQKQEENDIQEKPLAQKITPLVQLTAEKEETVQEKKEEDIQTKEEEQKLQTSAGTDGVAESNSNLENNLNSSKGGGTPLPRSTKTEMESGFGTDFSNVRVHSDSKAVQMNQELGSQAFANGNNIYFNEGKYNPNSQDGKHLLAHELTHTVQQGASKPAIQKKTAVSASPQPVENELPPVPEKEKAVASETATQKVEPPVNKTENKETTAKPEPKKEGTPENKVASTATTDVSLLPTQEAQVAEGDNNPVPEMASQNVASETPTDPIAGQEQMPVEEKPTEENKNGDPEKAAEEVVTTTPRSPKEDPNFQKLENRVTSTAKGQQEHEAPEAAAGSAQSAALSPANERESMAQSNQVDEMESTEAGVFNAEEFKAKLMERIKSMQLPTNQEQASNFDENNNISEVSSAATNDVQNEKEKAAGPVEQTTQQEPNLEAVPEREIVPLPEAPVGTQPASVNANAAMPPQRGEAEVSQPLQDNMGEVDQQMADNEITDEQLANSNEPKFMEGLDAKAQAKENTETAPQILRQQEQGILQNAQVNANTTGQAGLQQMHQDRDTSLNQVAGQQQQTGTVNTAERTRIAGEINVIYENAKADVEKILGDLDTNVNAKFKAGSEVAKTKFENYVEQKMDAYKDDRYSGLRGKARWIRDKFKGLPDTVNKFFVDGRQIYIDHMDTVITEVAQLVADKLNEAKTRIVTGKQEVQNYVNDLPDSLQKIGQDAAEQIATKFDELEESVNNKQDELIDSLAQQYTEGLEAVDARIEEMKAANRGLIDMVLDAIGAIIKVIIAIKNVLTNLLSAALEAIGAIISDPIGFLGNLISGIKQGFENFGTNILTHLASGMITWLTGSLGPMGIKIPENLFSLEGVFDLVGQILGLSWDFIRGKAVKHLGEPMVNALETGSEIFMMIKNEGIGGLWKHIKEEFADLQVTIMDAIKDMVITKVIEAGIKWILGLMSPAGAFVKAAMMIIDIVKFFIEKGSQIIELVSAFIEGIKAVASGSVGAVAKAIENALAKAIPVIIGFLASLLGVTGLTEKVQKIIGKVRKRIDKAVDKIILKAKNGFKKIVKSGKAKVKGAVAALFKWWEKKKVFKAKDGKKHTLLFKGKDDKARLMVRSDEQDYKDFITRLIIDESDPKRAEKVEAKVEAIKILETIEGLKKTNDANDAETQRNSIEFEKQLSMLAQKTAIFMESAEGEIPESTPPVYGGRSAGGFATSMKINVLTKKGSKGSSAVTSLTTGIFNKLGKRHESKASSVRFYKHGHLLSSHLHGPGDNFKNLTPQSESGNQKFESSVENTLKNNVNREDKPMIYTYKVEAVYEARLDKDTLKQDIGNEYANRIDDIDDESLKLKLEQELEEKKGIVDAEDQVATKFIVNAKPLNNNLKEISGENFSNFEVENNIKREADKYILPNELSDEERANKSKRKRNSEPTRPSREKTTRTEIDKVKQLLAEQIKTQQQIAVDVGVSINTVKRIKSGKII